MICLITYFFNLKKIEFYSAILRLVPCGQAFLPRGPSFQAHQPIDQSISTFSHSIMAGSRNQIPTTSDENQDQDHTNPNEDFGWHNIPPSYQPSYDVESYFIPRSSLERSYGDEHKYDEGDEDDEDDEDDYTEDDYERERRECEAFHQERIARDAAWGGAVFARIALDEDDEDVDDEDVDDEDDEDDDDNLVFPFIDGPHSPSYDASQTNATGGVPPAA